MSVKLSVHMFLNKNKPANQTNQTNQASRELGRIKSGKVARFEGNSSLSIIFRSCPNSTKNHTNNSKAGGMKHHSAKKKEKKKQLTVPIAREYLSNGSFLKENTDIKLSFIGLIFPLWGKNSF